MHGSCSAGGAPPCYAGSNTQNRHIVILERHRSMDPKPGPGQRLTRSLPSGVAVPAPGLARRRTGDSFRADVGGDDGARGVAAGGSAVSPGSATTGNALPTPDALDQRAAIPTAE